MLSYLDSYSLHLFHLFFLFSSCLSLVSRVAVEHMVVNREVMEVIQEAVMGVVEEEAALLMVLPLTVLPPLAMVVRVVVALLVSVSQPQPLLYSVSVACPGRA